MIVAVGAMPAMPPRAMALARPPWRRISARVAARGRSTVMMAANIMVVMIVQQPRGRQRQQVAGGNQAVQVLAGARALHHN